MFSDMCNQKRFAWLAIGIVLTFWGCSEEPATPLPPFDRSLDGKYRLLSMNFTEPVDLDQDGIKSTDVLSEAHLQSKKDTYVGLFETRLRSEMATGDDYQMFNQRLPLTKVITETQTGEFLEVSYGYTGALYKCFYRIGDENIAMEDDFIIAGYAVGFTVLLSSKNRLKAVHKQHFYVNEWMFLEIESEYEKIN